MPQERLQERRRSRRLKLQREALVRADTSLLDSTPGAENADFSLTFIGRTLDISEEGLALVLPSVRIDERFIERADRALSVVLDLPANPVEMQVSPVRLSRLDDADPGKGYLMGARITSQSEGGRRCLSEYLR